MGGERLEEERDRGRRRGERAREERERVGGKREGERRRPNERDRKL